VFLSVWLGVVKASTHPFKHNAEIRNASQKILWELFENSSLYTQEKPYQPYQTFQYLEISAGKIVGSEKKAHYAKNGFSRKYREFLEENGTPKDAIQKLAFPFMKGNNSLQYLFQELGEQKVQEMMSTEILYINAPRAYDCYREYSWAMEETDTVSQATQKTREKKVDGCLNDEYYTPNVRKLETYFIDSDEEQTGTLKWYPLNPYTYDSFDMEEIGEWYPTPLTIADSSIDAHNVHIRVQYSSDTRENILFPDIEQKLIFTRLLPWNIPEEDLKKKPYLKTPWQPVYHLYPYYEAEVPLKKGINKITFEYFTTTDLLRPWINGVDSYPIWER